MSQIADLISKVQMWQARCQMQDKIIENQREKIKELEARLDGHFTDPTIIEAEIIE